MRRRIKGNEEKNLTLTGHLDELRKRIIFSVIFFLIGALVSYRYSDTIIRDMTQIGNNIDFVFISPAELLIANIKIAMIGGLILAAPFLIIQIWLFVSPGLNRKERVYISTAIGMGGIFFILGAMFSYYMVIPTMLVFFMGFQMDIIAPMISFSSYLSFILSTIVAFGVIFELPILMILLTRFGIVKVSFIKKNRKYIVLAIFVLAAIITPPDVISQLLLALPMIVLTEVGIILSSILSKKE
ncbi:MAG: twin-arginine translocase subunit TatC [Gudongella sp.]|nr:twin-arginine translocase subunit TatC [Gudongella sp.]